MERRKMGRLEERKKEMNSLIHSFIYQSKKFTWYACFDYGFKTYFISGKKTAEFTYDYDYFNFVKSTKMLMSIRELLKKNHNEDVFILIRSMFESYLSTRYFSENNDKIDEFIFNPTMMALAYYNITTDGTLINRDKEEVGKLINPAGFKMGKDKKYYNDFYAFLCMFAHANYGVANLYTDGKGGYDLTRENYPIIVRLFTIFVFTKIFEHVVTVDGEDFIDVRTEKICYELVRKSIALQEELFDDVIEAYSKVEQDFYQFRNKRMIKMLNNMKKSLKEELGSLKK
ncbi:DUF5677 domain-containing protein [Wukongibacter sp. M2B1]|uniref:DUF5677 domain-containing protein n=1 Tax=Wukongibacter sp. M2B1 TaxID=3088895 RepID=UPI003D7B4F50